mmetsp:Transcript_2147/g.3318  ORF Transcript_2147/g.3318 Transcript_2147/m.3318 type:complete len:87 (+) Transcript_2147:282-542(+)
MVSIHSCFHLLSGNSLEIRSLLSFVAKYNCLWVMETFSSRMAYAILSDYTSKSKILDFVNIQQAHSAKEKKTKSTFMQRNHTYAIP